jgi:hypothetical protein
MKPRTAPAALPYVFAAAVLALVSSASAATRYKVLHYFEDKPAMSPESQLVVDSAGNLYGTACAY